MSGGGKGGGGSADIPTETTQTQQWMPPDFLGGANGPMSQYLSYSAQVLGQPYIQYGGQQVAGNTTDQNMGYDILRARALNGSQGYTQPSDQMYRQTMAGGYMPSVVTNPYLGQTTPGVSYDGGMSNGYLGRSTQIQNNPFLNGNNPYLNSAISSAQADVVDAYRRGTAAQTDASAARSRAMGGSAYNELVGVNNRQLADSLGQMTNSMRMNDYNQRAAMTANDIAMRAGYNAQDLSRNAGLDQSYDFQNAANRQAYDFQNQGMAANDLARNANLAGQDMNSFYNNWNAERGRQMGMMGYGDVAAGRDYADANALIGSGAQQQQYVQNLLNSGRTDFNDATNFLYNNLNRFSGVMSPLMGLGGTSQTSTNNAAQPGGGNALNGIVGAGMTGMGLYNMANTAGLLGGASAAGGLTGGLSLGGFTGSIPWMAL